MKMWKRRADGMLGLVAALGLMLAACGGDEPVVVQNPGTGGGGSVATPEATATPTPTPTPDETAEYNYNPVGKRDPFRSFVMEELSPDTKRVVTPLQRFDLDQLKIIGIIWGISSPRAMVVTPDGKGYVVQKGTLIGKNWGKVSRITQDEVIISEEYRDFEGRLIVTEVPLRLPKEEALDLE